MKLRLITSTRSGDNHVDLYRTDNHADENTSHTINIVNIPLRLRLRTVDEHVCNYDGWYVVGRDSSEKIRPLTPKEIEWIEAAIKSVGLLNA